MRRTIMLPRSPPPTARRERQFESTEVERKCARPRNSTVAPPETPAKESENTPKVNPLKDVASAIDLPPLGNNPMAPGVSLGKVHLEANAKLQVDLLGGENKPIMPFLPCISQETPESPIRITGPSRDAESPRQRS